MNAICMKLPAFTNAKCNKREHRENRDQSRSPDETREGSARFCFTRKKLPAQLGGRGARAHFASIPRYQSKFVTLGDLLPTTSGKKAYVSNACRRRLRDHEKPWCHEKIVTGGERFPNACRQARECSTVVVEAALSVGTERRKL
jgi:hypothetical protein